MTLLDINYKLDDGTDYDIHISKKTGTDNYELAKLENIE